MFTHYIGIDVAKSKFDSVIYDPVNNKYSKATKVKYDITSIDKYFDDISKEIDLSESIFIIESTGCYHISLCNILSMYKCNIHLINPIITSNACKGTVRNSKNDKLDAKLIANVGFQNRVSPNWDKINKYVDLKNLTRNRRYLVEEVAALKTQFCAIIDCTMTGLSSLFSNIYGHTVLNLLVRHESFDSIGRMHVQTLSTEIKELSKGSLGEQTAIDLKNLIKKNTRLDTQESKRLELNLIAKRIIFIEDQISTIEATVSSEFKQSSFQYDILSIPGIGKILGAEIVAEIGDITRFKSPDQIIAYAGLDPKVKQSGNMNMVKTRISKRGSPYLRHALFLSAQFGYCHNEDMKLYYDRERAKGKSHRAALNAIARKLIRAIYGMYKSETSFDSKIFISNI